MGTTTRYGRRGLRPGSRTDRQELSYESWTEADVAAFVASWVPRCSGWFVCLTDLVCDPCAGGATTLLAAAIEGRRAIGAERDPATFASAQRRLACGYTPTFPGMEAL